MTVVSVFFLRQKEGTLGTARNEVNYSSVPLALGFYFFLILRKVKANSALRSVLGETPFPLAAFLSLLIGMSFPLEAPKVFLNAPGFFIAP